MADVKISALPAATTPLAGTEILPIVQGASTVKVSNNDLRPKQIQSNTTSGVLQIIGPAAASTRIMTTPDANFTTARTDAAQSFTGDQTLSTGNLVIGTSGKGIDFSATPDATATSELLADYEEGTWTPTINAETVDFDSVTYAIQTGSYTKVGRLVFVRGTVATSAVTKGSASGTVTIRGLPYTAATDASLNIGVSNYWASVQPISGYVSAAKLYPQYRSGSTTTGVAMDVTLVDTGAFSNYMIFSAVYSV